MDCKMTGLCLTYQLVQEFSSRTQSVSFSSAVCKSINKMKIRIKLAISFKRIDLLQRAENRFRNGLQKTLSSTFMVPNVESYKLLKAQYFYLVNKKYF